MSPQAKLEHIIYLVREYEADISDQHKVAEMAVLKCSMQMQLGISTSEKLAEIPSIEPKAQLYLERIEAFLES